MAPDSSGNSIKPAGIDHFILRCVALAGLTCYVTAFSGIVTYYPLVIILGLVGYSCLPVFALLCAEAYRHHSKPTAFLVRNLIIAVLCAVPYRFAFYNQKNLSDIRSYFSMALTGFFCFGALMFYDRMKTKNQRIFCVAFLCAISFLIGMEFAPYMPILVYAIHIYRKEQDGKDLNAAAGNDKDRLEAMSRRKYLFSNYTFTKISFFVVTFSVVIFAVSLLFQKFDPGYRTHFSDEITRNYCMPGMLLSLPFIRTYNGREGLNNTFTKVVFRLYYLLLLVLAVMIKTFFLFDYGV